MVLIVIGCTNVKNSDEEPNVGYCPSQIGVAKYYLEVNSDVFPAEANPTSEISWEEFKKQKAEKYAITVCKGTSIPLEFAKYDNGRIVYAYEYVYKKNKVSELKMLFVSGSATTYQLLQEI